MDNHAEILKYSTKSQTAGKNRKTKKIENKQKIKYKIENISFKYNNYIKYKSPKYTIKRQRLAEWV